MEPLKAFFPAQNTNFQSFSLRALLLPAAAVSGFQPYRSPTWSSQVKPAAADDKRIGAPAHDAGEWNVFYLDLHNVDFEANRARCPETTRLLQSIGRPYGQLVAHGADCRTQPRSSARCLCGLARALHNSLPSARR